MRLRQLYDALGRITQSWEMRSGAVIPETEYSWKCDTAEGTPLPMATFTAGRLTQTKSSIGDMHVSYDACGRVEARAFVDTNGEHYFERSERHFDGTHSTLEFQLRDTGYTAEQYRYSHDSASRLRSVVYRSTADVPLYAADIIDAWGRVRSATYGSSTTYKANYADTGRRLPLQKDIILPSQRSRRVVFIAYDAIGREMVAAAPKTTRCLTPMMRRRR